MNPVNTLTLSFLNIRFNIVLQLTFSSLFQPGMCCQFVDKGLAPESYIFKHSNDSYSWYKASYTLFSSFASKRAGAFHIWHLEVGTGKKDVLMF
jgi:hypothetical protein